MTNLPDSKKVQTLINMMAEAAITVKVAADQLDNVKALYVAANPDVTGTPLEGNVTLVNNWITSLRMLADSTITNGVIAAKVPTHRGEAL